MSVDMLVDINWLSAGRHVGLYVNHVLAKNIMLTKSGLLVLVSMLADNYWLTYCSIGHQPSAVPPTAHKNI